MPGFEPFQQQLAALGPHKLGRSCLYIRRLDKIDTAVLEEIVPAADPGSRTFVVKVALPTSEGLYPGMFGRLLIAGKQAEQLLIPAAAVHRVGQLTYVMVPAGQDRLRRYVRVSATANDDELEVLSGLAPGEQVILDNAS